MSRKTQKKRPHLMPPYDPSTMKAGRHHDVTFCGLSHWYKHAFEKLGWMVLAKKQGMGEKVRSYVHSLDMLRHDIKSKINTTRDPDKKDDLKIMWDNLNILIDHAKMDF
jgi:hypothetical protein